MNVEVGMFVRTIDNGYSSSLIYKIKNEVHLTIIKLHETNFKGASHNIIDLIEVGDYVNGKKVTNIGENGFLVFGDTNRYITGNSDIKSIVTKEQFKAVEYEVKE